MTQGGWGNQENGGHGPGTGVKPTPASWNQAMQGGDGFLEAVLKAHKRPAIITSALFFSAFVWLFILYNVRHLDSARVQTPAVGLNQNHGAAAATAYASVHEVPIPTANFANRLPAAGNQLSASSGAAMFGNPRAGYVPVNYATAAPAVAPVSYGAVAATSMPVSYGGMAAASPESSGYAGFVPANSFNTPMSAPPEALNAGIPKNFVARHHAARKLVVTR